MEILQPKSKQEEFTGIYNHILKCVTDACDKLLSDINDIQTLHAIKQSVIDVLKNSLHSEVYEAGIVFKLFDTVVVPGNFYTALMCCGVPVEFDEVEGKMEYITKNGTVYKWTSGDELYIIIPKPAQYISLSFNVKKIVEEQK